MTSIRQIRRDNENRIDYGIILNVMVLAIIGLLSVYSTTTLIEGETSFQLYSTPYGMG